MPRHTTQSPGQLLQALFGLQSGQIGHEQRVSCGYGSYERCSRMPLAVQYELLCLQFELNDPGPEKRRGRP
eukprot:2809327-Pleurochrysis_carterae.AAC.2